MIFTLQVPPDITPLGADMPKPSAHAAMIIMNKCFGWFSPMLLHYFRNRDTKVHGELAIKVFPKPRDIGHSRRIEASHLQIHNFGQSIRGRSVERTTATAKSPLLQGEAKLRLQAV